MPIGVSVEIHEGKVVVPVTAGKNSTLETVDSLYSSPQYVQISCASEFCCVLDSHGKPLRIASRCLLELAVTLMMMIVIVDQRWHCSSGFL